MPAKVTALDVARRAGVSQPTVSRALARSKSVSKALAERVLQAARELGYRPNTLARSLITGRSRSIGVVIPPLEDAAFVQSLQHITQALEAKGYRVLLSQLSASDLGQSVERLQSHGADGLLLAELPLKPAELGALAGLTLPVVQLGAVNQSEPQQTGILSCKHFEAAELAARHLAGMGRTRIAHISLSPQTSIAKAQRSGFAAGLETAGLKPIANIDGAGNRERAMAATQVLFESNAKPDAIFAGSDHMAFGIQEVLSCELGLSSPEDVALIGFGDTPMSAWKCHALTTLRQPTELMAHTAVTHLIDLIEGKAKEAQNIALDCELVLRKTA